MKKILMTGLIFLPLLGCDAPSETQQPVVLQEKAGTRIFTMKSVQCVFKLDINEILEADWKINGSESPGDIRAFENRLDLLSGFDLAVLPGDNQGSPPEDGSSIIYVASYADCETTNAIVNHLTERHMKIRLDPPIESVDPDIYVNLAKAQGYDINEAAFSKRP